MTDLHDHGRDQTPGAPWRTTSSVLTHAGRTLLVTGHAVGGAWLTLTLGSVLPLLAAGGLCVVLLGVLTWRIAVDDEGLTVHGGLGWPKVTLPATDVESVTVRDIDPMAQFGGWGLRSNLAGEAGVVARKGPGIVVQRSSGQRFIVTTEDAPAGAARLEGAARRARG